MNTLTPAVRPIGKTTLSAAITSASQVMVKLATGTITVGAYTAVKARNPQWGLFVDGEIMAVIDDAATPLFHVARGQAGTQASVHASGAAVWAAPLNDLVNTTLATLPYQAKRLGYSTVPIGSVAYGSFGNDTTDTNGDTYVADVVLPAQFACTGIKILNGTTAGSTDKGLVMLWDENGTLVATSSLAGAAIAGTDAFQARAFTPGPVLLPAGRYFIGYQTNGTSDKFRTIAANTFVDVVTDKLAAGTFGVVPTLVVPTTFSANEGPVAYLY